jgi:hypothetical protein
MKGRNERASVCGSRDDFEDSAYIGAVSDRPGHLTQPYRGANPRRASPCAKR